jgi:hypothetical protein
MPNPAVWATTFDSMLVVDQQRSRIAFAKSQYGPDAHDKANSAKQHARPRGKGHAG